MSRPIPASKKPVPPAPLTPAERAAYDALLRTPSSTTVALAEEAFALATCNLDEWPEARDRMRRARRHVLRNLHGEPFGLEPTEDLWFAALFVARALDVAGFSSSEIVAVFDAILLPVDAVPLYTTPVGALTPRAKALALHASELAGPSDWDDAVDPGVETRPDCDD